MKSSSSRRRQEAWGNFRLSVIGQLLASPPPHGQLAGELDALSKKQWQHPISGEPFQVAFGTIEEWYYKARTDRNSPVKALEGKLRRDVGRCRALSSDVQRAIEELHQQHPSWSHQLHYDNLLVIAMQKSLGDVPSYATVRRYRQAHGLIRRKVPRNADRSGVITALERHETREQRSFETTHVLGLVHSDFHHCSRKLVAENGEWVKPVLVGILDDRSRLVCHAQWYWRETAENFVHALSQAFLKRGLPRALMTDNGSPMTAGETTQGLERLSILHQTTLPYSPEMNGKQESFWGQVEGRLMAMLEGEHKLTLRLLNEATMAWIEMDYHRRIHAETGQTPLQRFLEGPEVSRPTPSPEELRMAFTTETARTLRRSDCTISIEGHRYEVPSTFRHLKHISVRYAHWDLSEVLLVNAQSGGVIGRIFPRDLEKNADGRRRKISPITQPWQPPAQTGIAPLLMNHLQEYTANGLPMSYLPKDEDQ
jgi:transposase InsO family protein